MPTISTLKGLALALVIATNTAQATVVVPCATYNGVGPGGVPDEWVRNKLNSRGSSAYGKYGQGRSGIHLTVGTPPQHVWVSPHFYDSETYVRSLELCPKANDYECEQTYGGLFATNESSTFKAPNKDMFGTDAVSFFDAFPDLGNDKFKLGVSDVSDLKRVMNLFGKDGSQGTLGLGPNSTFFQTFFPGKEQVGIYVPGGNSTHGKPAHSNPMYSWVTYELEFDGYNQSHFTGEKFTMPIGPLIPESEKVTPFMLNITGVKVGNKNLLENGESYLANFDLGGRSPNILPSKVYNQFLYTTGAKSIEEPVYKTEDLPKNPKDMFNLTFTFSNGEKEYSFTIAQPYLFSDSFDEESEVNLYSDEHSFNSNPTISINQLGFTSYIGIDHAAGEWWLAKAVHPWTDYNPPSISSSKTNGNEPQNATSDTKKNAAGGLRDNLKMVTASAAALAAAVFLLC
ncbi:hypothetical protein TWF481_002344 [Arthrobotrys musiformis]|uniref:Peptidase A1 domain-containing protein n=1 Tax=Arthrobotrys musiformis TaxID=47236 RepID=A0AAV9VT11_9PEZI